MATIQDAVNIFENVGNAMVGVGKFIYGDRAEIDAFRAKQYPVILIERNMDVPNGNITKHRTRLNVRVSFFDTFHRVKEAQENDQASQVGLENLCFQYLKEVQRLFLQDGRITILNSDFTGGRYSFNDTTNKLIKLEVIVPVEIHGECSSGQFNYS